MYKNDQNLKSISFKCPMLLSSFYSVKKSIYVTPDGILSFQFLDQKYSVTFPKKILSTFEMCNFTFNLYIKSQNMCS